MIPEPFASYPEVSNHLHYYRERAMASEARLTRAERLLRNVLATVPDGTLPRALVHEIQESLRRD